MKTMTRDIQVSALVAAIAMTSTIAQAGDRDWTYTNNGIGQVLTADGPRTDVSDITTYTYDSAGHRTSMTNALGHQTQMQNHNDRGQAQLLIDANLVETELSYHPRGWLLSSTVKHPGGNTALDATTSYTYDNEGQLLTTTLPNGVVLNNEYDAAHRLVAISNNQGERIEYTLDAAGNRIGEVTKASGGTITRDITQAYDELNRLIQITGAAGQTTTFTYDRNGNQVTITDGNTNTTTRTYDALDRLTGTFAPLTHNALYGHDDQDNVTQITDPKALVTTYDYDGLDNLDQLSSPDTGITSYSYDEAGNRLTQADANGVTVTYTYDALNRLTSTSYPNTALNVSYGYDAGAYGKGRLTAITDATGTTTLTYDHRGNVLGQSLDTGSMVLDLAYAYNTADQLTQITYPSGRTVDYTRGADGLISGASTTDTSGTQALASNVDYLPYGPMNTLDYGNGLQYNATYDLDYRVSQMTHGAVRDAQYGYDNADNITGITDNLSAASSQVFTYDALNRLDTADGSYGALSYTYDNNGNRLTYTDPNGTFGYAYDANSHRLVQTNFDDYQYDNNGNLVGKITRADASGDGTLYIYDDHNRLTQVIQRETISSVQTDTVLATYAYNANGQRTTKITATETIHYLYSREGLLLAEVRDDGLVLREYMYLNGQPLAVAYTTETLPPPTTGAEIIMDDEGPGTSFTGTWENVRKKGALNDYYQRSENNGYTYRWTPSGLNATDYEVWAWWPKTNKNNPTAQYSIVHNGQTDISVQDQSTLGKQWVQLGTYEFSGSGGEYIEIDDAGGKTAADGIRLIEIIQPPPVVTTALYYIHNDHLGTPQVITDQSQTLAWQADYKPFGEVSITANTIANNLRFPGQYYDQESGLHQNYFRDYDPSLGRYIQSDLVGLTAGLNSYSYALNSPMIFNDPTGEIVPVIAFALAGAAVGGINGAIGAIAQNGSARDVVIAAGSGALIGGAVGAVAPAAAPGVLGGVLSGGTIGLSSNLVGQIGTISATNGAHTDFSPGSAITSLIGGGIGGGLGAASNLPALIKMLAASGFTGMADALRILLAEELTKMDGADIEDYDCL